MSDAACRNQAPNRRQDPAARDPWFPEQGESPNDGRVICFTCPVRTNCIGLRDRTGSKEGMWGGEIIDRNGEVHVKRLGA